MTFWKRQEGMIFIAGLGMTAARKNMFPKSDKFWNPLLESLPREKLAELQVKKFRRILKWAFDNSKFHRQLYKDAGLTPEDIRTMADIARVPKVEKSMMRGIQKKAA